MTKIWERYFLREMLKVFFLFIGAFYFLYILINYTSRTSSMIRGDAAFYNLIIYYVLMFIKRIDLLIPFALMVATIKTLCGLNLHNELVALLASGVKLKRLLRPFVAMGLLCVALMYFNFQVLVPYAWYKVKLIEDRHFGEQESRGENRASKKSILRMVAW